MPFLRTSVDERNEHVSIQTELGAEWKFQTGPPIPLELLHANLSQTFGNLSLSASGGQPTILADLSKSLGPLSCSSQGATATAASLSKIYGALSFTATGTSGTIANLSKTLGSLTLLASEEMGVTSQVSGSNFTTTSITLVDITGLSFAVDTGANHLYEVDACIKCQSDSTAGLKFSVGCTSSGATGEYMVNANATQVGSAIAADFNALGVAESNARSTTANTDSIAYFKAMISTTAGNAGNITIKLQKQTSGTATVYIGSRMTVTTLT